MDAEAFQHIMGVNVLGTFQMVRACAPHLQAARGAIVNVSSIAGALGHRLVGALHRVEGRGQLDDAALGARAGAATSASTPYARA